jgi:hypothetical protein
MLQLDTCGESKTCLNYAYHTLFHLEWFSIVGVLPVVLAPKIGNHFFADKSYKSEFMVSTPLTVYRFSRCGVMINKVLSMEDAATNITIRSYLAAPYILRS